MLVALHGFGSNSGQLDFYMSLSERVNTGGFAVLLPNGTADPDGTRFWNAADWCCDFDDSGVDDMAYLTGLVTETRGYIDVGRVFFFGHSNGGFMSYRMACDGLPGLRAIASLSGTASLDAADCDGAAPVSVLHIHGTEDKVVRYGGAESTGYSALRDDESYAGAEELVERWASRAGCDLNATEILPAFDIDEDAGGAETTPVSYTAGCAHG